VDEVCFFPSFNDPALISTGLEYYELRIVRTPLYVPVWQRPIFSARGPCHVCFPARDRDQGFTPAAGLCPPQKAPSEKKANGAVGQERLLARRRPRAKSTSHPCHGTSYTSYVPSFRSGQHQVAVVTEYDPLYLNAQLTGDRRRRGVGGSHGGFSPQVYRLESIFTLCLWLWLTGRRKSAPLIPAARYVFCSAAAPGGARADGSITLGCGSMRRCLPLLLCLHVATRVWPVQQC
jgi:hypothetical protein